MRTSKSIFTVFAIILFAGQALATSGVPSLELSTATMTGGAGQTLTLMVVPDGSGPGFAGATDPAGSPADATIEVYLADPLDTPIPGYPREDIWLEWDASPDGLEVCNPNPYGGGSFAVIHLDVEMDAQGISHFSLPPYAGGYVDGPVFVVVNGSRLIGPGLPLRFNSPDISGDGRVDLADVQLFAVDFFGAYHFRSDLAHDGAVNLSDVAKLAEHFGAGCP